MRRRVPFLFAAIASVACAPGPDESGQGATRIFVHDTVALSFEVPADWQETRDGAVVILSGSEKTDAHYTTITVQIAARHDEPLPDALVAAYEPVSSHRHFAWHLLAPAVVTGRPAVRYSNEFELHEVQRFKAGLWIDAGACWLDISYGAPVALFASSLPVWEQALATLMFEPSL